ncbi:MAG: site-specific DNA-methyltransferase [Bacteroidetes bacterium]|nr:site-specific DNA-methyltransferase [Bacteroidota bacterium]
MPSSEVYLEDCVTALKRFNDNHFDLAIVDPPYGIDITKQFENANKVGTKSMFKQTKGIVKKNWDAEIPTAEYFDELKRVSKNQIIWGGNYFLDYLGNTKCMLIWDKMNGGNNMADAELAWTSFDKAVRMFRMHHFSSGYETKIHLTQKPTKLYDWILSKFANEGDLILDTHLGSGSSRIAAYKGGFNFVGFEIDAEYYEKQEKRFNDFKSQLRMF